MQFKMSTTIVWRVVALLIIFAYRNGKTDLNSGFGALAKDIISGEGEAGAMIDENPRTPLYMLLLLMIPDSRDYAGWDAGPSLLAGARVALKEVNERSDFLHGYRLGLIESGHEACALPSTTHVQGLVNLIDNAINPFREGVGPIVAVGGLMCSGPTSSISPVAGRPGVDILQLSGSNSPVFVQDKDSYRYLWRFLVSASIYGDLLQDLMDIYNWTRVVVVYDSGSVYYRGIALAFLNDINASDNKEVAVVVAITLTDNVYFETVISSIKSNFVRVIFVFTNSHQAAKLLCMVQEEGLVYPNYQWVLVDNNIEFLTSALYCEEETVLAGANHALITSFQLYQDSDKILVSNETYEYYEEKYQMEFEQIQDEYNATFTPDSEYAGIVYDQVWALAMALHTAIPILKRKNLSIEHYSYGQPEITSILQQELSKVQFVGASSQVRFGANRDVSTKVNIFRIQTNRVEKLVGEYNGLAQVALTINVSADEVPDDEWNPEPILLPVYATSILLTADGLVMLFVTFNLVLIIIHRNKPELKAISPYLSVLMFIGCYILCASALCNIIMTGISIKDRVFTAFCNLHYIFLFNGVILIFNTLFIRLLRVYRIFSNKSLSQMSKCAWSNYCLVLVILSLNLLPNVFLVIWLTVNPISYTTDIEYIYDGESLSAQKFSFCTGDNIGVWIGTFIGIVLLVAILILLLAVNTRNVRYSNFKDTKKVNAFLGCLLTVCTLSVTIGLILKDTGVYFAAVDIMLIVGLSLLVPVLCQGFLFMPKVIPASSPNTLSSMFLSTSEAVTRVKRVSLTVSQRVFR